MPSDPRKVALVTGAGSGMGLATARAFAETADALGEEFDRVVAINMRGVWSCMKYELIQMREQGSGAIVNCSSLGGLVGVGGRGLPVDGGYTVQ